MKIRFLHPLLTIVSLIFVVLLSTTDMKGQALVGSYSVGVGSTITVSLSDTYIRTLNMSRVIGSSWTASNSGISISSKSDTKCNVTGISIGQTRLYYKCSYNIDGYYRSFDFYYEINVTPTYATSIVVSPSEVKINPGETVKLSAQVYPSNASNKSVKWNTSDASVAEVNSNGLVKGISSGETRIHAYTSDGTGFYDYCKVIVNEVTKVESVTIIPSSLKLEVDDKYQIVATILPDNAFNKRLIWSSSDDNILSVDSNGNVTAKSPGKVIITATTTDGSSLTATCNALVSQKINSIKLSESNITISKDSSYPLKLDIHPETADNKFILWNSSNTGVARVNENGVVTGIAVGEAKITAKTTDDSELSASCQVKVIIPVSDIILSESEIYMNNGSFKEISASVLPNDATIPKLEWESNNTDVAEVVAGSIIAKADGQTEIIAKSTDGSNVKSSCLVTVKTPVTDILLEPSEITIIEGNYIKLKSILIPANATNKEIEWKSNNTDIASVIDGLILAHKCGNTIITATAKDESGTTAECKVTVGDESSLAEVQIDEDIYTRIFSISGVFIFEGKFSDANLPKGVYIVTYPNGRYKRIIK